MNDERATVSNAFGICGATWFAFLLFVFSLALMQPFINYRNLRLSISDFIFPFLFALFVISVLARQIAFRFHKVYFSLLAYFAAMLISALFSSNPPQSFIKLAGEFYLLSLVVIAHNLVRDTEDLKAVLKSWLAGTLLAVTVGLLSIFLFYFQRDSWLLNYTISIYGAVPVGNYPRLASTFGSASMFCNFLNVGFFMLIIAEHLKLLSLRIFFVLLVLLTICAAFTVSSSIGGVILGFALWLGFLFRGRRNLLSKFAHLGGVVFAVVFFFSNFIALQNHPTAPFTFHFLGHEFFPSSRLLVWLDSARTFFDNLLTGEGLGLNACQVVYKNTEGTTAFLTDAHNVFLSVAAQNGLIGLISFGVLFLHLIWLRYPSENKKTAEAAIFSLLRAAFICSFLYQGLTGSFEDARHLWVLVGLLVSAHSFAEQR